mgnify:FL=1
MAVIINYGAGNLRSVQKACEFIGTDAKISSDAADILSADRVILPGVGAFGDCMAALNASGLADPIRTIIDKGVPFLGICLGLQLLFEASDESPDAKGLGILKGRCVKIPQSDGVKIPHIGWNSITFPNPSPLFTGIEDGSFVYFVHSYYMQPNDKSVITAVCDYSASLPVALSRGNIHATQFHPEKSGDVGLKILKNFIDLRRES